MKFLVPCHHLVATGGLLRFERIGRALNEKGHTLTFAPAESRADFEPRSNVVSLDQAANVKWDATLIPGAGFPPGFIASMNRFASDNFGTRVQMVLNDQCVRERFLRVNAVFAPNMVIFNNEAWPPGSYRDFRGQRFHHLVGGVDTSTFRLSAQRRSEPTRFVMGAQLHKNPGPLLDALALLPPDFCIRFFGFDRLEQRKEIATRFGGRVEFAGPLFDEQLVQYYEGLDAMISTETHAGWANVVAEAMASGVPVITTTAGTLSIAKADITALVLGEEAHPALLARAALRLRDNPHEAQQLALNARAHIENFDWTTYTDRLLSILSGFDGTPHYMHAPELGLYGKTAEAERLDGLAPLLDAAKESGAVLDLGAAEGFIAHAFSVAGSARVDAYELEYGRVAEARRLFPRSGLTFNRADLSQTDDLKRILAAAPPGGYDLVLYLGVHHHLPETRLHILKQLLSIASKTVALRMPTETYHDDGIMGILLGEGFVQRQEATASPGSFAGPLYIFERTDG